MEPPLKCGQCKYRDSKGICRKTAPQAHIVPQSLSGKATLMWPYVDGNHDGCWEGELETVEESAASAFEEISKV